MRIGFQLTAGALALAMASPAAAYGDRYGYSGGYYAPPPAACCYGPPPPAYDGCQGGRDFPPPCAPPAPRYDDHRYACPTDCGEIRLDDSFFADAGGVGPAFIGRGGGGGGGAFVIAGSGASAGSSAAASASASASARASVNVSIRFRPPPRHYKPGKGHHGGGGKKGCC